MKNIYETSKLSEAIAEVLASRSLPERPGKSPERSGSDSRSEQADRPDDGSTRPALPRNQGVKHMVARVRQPNPQPRTDETEVLVVTLVSGAGLMLDQQTAINPGDAVKVALRVISHRPALHAGDMMTVKRPNNGGEVHQPRETD